MKKAFTLIELLVVIAIIALLLAIVVPGLKMAKLKAASIVCMTNAKNLALGWFTYTDDNDGNIMSASMNGTTHDGTSSGRRIPAWIKAPMTAAGTVLEAQSNNVVRDEDEIRGIEAGALDPYLKSPKSFNCPTDRVKALPQYDTVDPEKFVTFALADCLAGVAAIGFNPNWRIMKYSQITSPADRYNFVETAEERNYTVLGHFVFGSREVNNNVPEVWWGPMAVNHGDSSVLGYCDGHAEVHRWQDEYTKERVEKLSRQGTDTYNIDTASGFNVNNSVDIAYMAKGWAYRLRK
jgi:prepilin-type N-terminal cleavage/methylation domain-containing protein